MVLFKGTIRQTYTPNRVHLIKRGMSIINHVRLTNV